MSEFEPLFDPARQPAIDEYGFTSHPDIDRFMIGHDGGEWQDGDEGLVDVDGLLRAGWATAFVTMENDATADDFEAWLERGEPGAPEWSPTPPDGDGWRLVARYDTEDSPAAMFVRPVDGAKVGGSLQ